MIVQSNELITNAAPFTLVYGDPGVGKTTFIKGVPKPALFFECGIDGGRKVLYDTPDINFEKEPIVSNSAAQTPAALLLAKLQQYAADGTLSAHRSIIIDPATNLMLDARANKSLAKGKDLTFGEQGEIMEEVVVLFKYLHQLAGLGWHVVVITHATERVIKDFNTTTESINICPYLSKGMLKDAFNMFDNVIRLSSKNGIRFMQLSESEGVKAKARANEDTLGKYYVPNYNNLLNILSGQEAGEIALKEQKGIL